MISFQCVCGHGIKVKDDLAGKRGKCPQCRQLVTIPPAAGAPAAPGPANVGQRDAPTLLPGAAFAVGGRDPETISPQYHSAAVHTHAGSHAVPAGVAPEHFDFLAPALEADEMGRLGSYRILKILGVGGMGVVFQAEDPQLKRKVAIKAMLPALAASDSAKQRFLREAQTAAAIEHDHIVPIYQVGEDRGVPFIAMPFLKGEPLDQRLERDKALPIADIVRIGREAAKGLAAAHAAGLVHRDIKPANLWLEGEEGRVKILDFGLARAAADNANLTQQGAIIGTPAYMAPEQAAGQVVDARCDLFSLGCVLYRMCTGQAPFKGADAVSTLVSVAMDNPLPVAELRPELPRALSKLVMQLLAKGPEQRPQSARDVAEALQGIDGKTVEVTIRPREPERKLHGGGASRREPARKQRRRSRKQGSLWPWVVVAGVLGLALMAVIVVLWQTPHGLVRIESDDPNVEIVFDKTGPTIKGADKEPIKLRPGEHGIVVKRGDIELEADKFVLRKGETITLKVALLQGELRVTADGKLIASRNLPRAPIVVPVATVPKPVEPRPAESPTFENSLGMELVLVPKGRAWLGGGGGKPGDKEVEIEHDFYLGKYAVTQEEWQKVMGSNPSLFSRTGGNKRAVKDIPDADLKRFPVENINWHEAQLFLARLNERDKHAGWSYRVPTDTEWEYACRGGPMADKSESAFDFYFDKPTNQLLPDQTNFNRTLGRPCKVGSYKPNRLGLYDMHGNVAVMVDDSGAVGRVTSRGAGWVFDSGQCRAAVRRGAPRPHRAGDLGLRVARVPVPLAAVPKPVEPQTAASSAEDVWAAMPAGQQVRRVAAPGTVVFRAIFSPDGRYVFSSSWGPGIGAKVQMRDVTTGEEVRRFEGHPSGVRALAVSSDGRTLLTGGDDATGRLWDVRTGKELHRLQGNTERITMVVFSPDGRRAATSGGDRNRKQHLAVHLWETQTGRELGLLRGHTAETWGLAYAPDGRQLASASDDGTVRLWDAGTGAELYRFTGHTGYVSSAAFAPNGKYIVSSGSDLMVRVWDVEGKKQHRCFAGHTDWVGGVAFSPDSSLVLSCSTDKTIRLWDVNGGKELMRLEGHTGGVGSIAFSPEGRYALSGSADGTIRLWRLPR